MCAANCDAHTTIQSLRFIALKLCIEARLIGGMVESMSSRRAFMPNSQAQGAQAERYVKQILLAHQWRLLEQNWTCRYGEIDLLLTKQSLPSTRMLVVEVKARRRSGLDGWGIAAFDQAKRRCLARSLQCWQAANPWSEGCCFEVVLALVALPVQRHWVRWIRIETLAGVSW